MGRTRTRTAAGIVLDTGALIALERGDKRMIALLRRALAQGRAFRVPAGVVGQAWRNGRVQVILGRFLRSEEVDSCLTQDEPEKGIGFSHKMSLKGRIGMLGIDHQHGRFRSDEPGAGPGVSGRKRRSAICGQRAGRNLRLDGAERWCGISMPA